MHKSRYHPWGRSSFDDYTFRSGYSPKNNKQKACENHFRLLKKNPRQHKHAYLSAVYTNIALVEFNAATFNRVGCLKTQIDTEWTIDWCA